MTITGQEILNLLKNDSKVDPDTLELLKPYILVVPTVLKDYLDRAVTPRNVFECGAAFRIYCFSNGLAEAIFNTVADTLAPDVGDIIKEVVKTMSPEIRNDLVSGTQETTAVLLEVEGPANKLFDMVCLGPRIVTIEEILKSVPRLILISVSFPTDVD